MSDTKQPIHSLNLLRIQSLDFSIRGFLPHGLNPVIIFRGDNCDFHYYLKLQDSTWLSEGGNWINSERTYHITDEDNLVFTLEGLKQSLEKNKNKILLKYGDFSVPLTAQEVGKIIELIEYVEKKVDEDAKKRISEREAENKRHEEYLKEYNEKMNNLRQERQKLFENQENAL